MDTVFTKVINRELPAKIFYETDEVIVIADHRPRRPIHLLIISKAVYANYQSTPPEVLAICFETVKIVADKLGIPDHYQLSINNGLGQEIDHFHIHFMSNKGVDKLVFLDK